MVAGEVVRYVLRRLGRRRNVHLVVADGGALEVRAPYRFSRAAAERLVVENSSWVLRSLDRARRQRAARPVLAEGVVMRVLDDCLTLMLVEAKAATLCGRRAVDRVWRDADRLCVHEETGDAASLAEHLQSWYRRQARICLEPRLDVLAERLDVQPATLTIRGQKTRWGSCSARGNISLNWRLMLVPGELAEYVLVHELCHLRHMNHSAAFWAMVARIVPDHERRRAALRALQSSLPL